MPFIQMNAVGKVGFAAAVLFVLLAAGARGEIFFASRLDSPVGSAPTSLAVLDSAARMLVIGNDEGIAVLRANQRGELTFAGQNSAVRFVKSLAVVDLNGDGRNDVACVDGRSPALFVLFAQPHGDFGAPVRVELGGPARLVRARGTERGGAAAVLVATDSALLIVRAKRKAKALVAETVADKTRLIDVASGDFDGDGNGDLALLDTDRQILSLLREDAGFSVSAQYASAGHSQVLAVETAAGTALFLANDSSIVQLRPRAGDAQAKTVWRGGDIGGLAGGDFNGDGRPDVIVGEARRGIVRVLLGGADGVLHEHAAYSVGREPGEILLADVTGDARLDAVVLNRLGDSATVLPGSGDGSFLGQLTLLGEAADCSGIVVAELNGDRHTDIAVTSARSGLLQAYLGNGLGGFRALPPLRIGRETRSLAAVPTGEGTGALLAVADFFADRIVFVAIDAAGIAAVRGAVAVGAGPTAIAAGSFNGDEPVDLAVASLVANEVTLLYNDGAGGFSRGARFPVIERPTFLMVGDINRDRRPDLVVGSDRGPEVSILHSGSNGLRSPERGDLGDVTKPQIAEDLDLDGHVDLVVPLTSEDAIGIFPGEGEAQFAPPRLIRVGRHPSGVGVGDFNEDGRADLAIIHQETGSISVLLNISPTGRR